MAYFCGDGCGNINDMNMNNMNVNNMNINGNGNNVNQTKSFDLYDMLCTNNMLLTLLTSFFFAMLFAPWSKGTFWLVIYIIGWELLILFLSRNRIGCWSLEIRVGVIFSSVLGFIVGRTLYKRKGNKIRVLNRGRIPFLKTQPQEDDE